MAKKYFQYLLICAVLTASPTLAVSQGTTSIDDVAKVSILPGWQTDTGRHMAAIRIQLQPGWKTYWRAPGESGIPPRFAWEGSSNLKSVRFMWPTPKVFYQNGIRAIGYSDEVVIPMELTASDPSEDEIGLRGKMELGICKDVCIPVTVSFSAELDASTSPDPSIKASLRDRPATAKEAGVGKVTCEIEPIADGLRLTARIEVPKMGPKEVTVVELPDQTIWISQATTERQGSHIVTVAEMVPPNAAPFMLSRSDVRFTVLGDRGAVNIQGCTAG